MKIIAMQPIQIEDSNPSLIKQVGFTLIELSIVLVIIGLIVGGVLVGQDLIKAAEIRSTIGQYEKYNATMNTFRTKYNGMPGDLLYTQANAFGINPAAGSLTSAAGDGNSLIESTATTNYNIPLRETVLIWQQLSAANLVDGSYGADLTVAGVPAVTTPSTYLPSAKLGRGNYWIAGSSAGLNYYGLLAPTALGASGASYTAAAGGGVTPVEAYNIDSKLDDGAPHTGIVQARGNTAMGAAADSLFPALGATTAGKWTNTTGVSGDCVIGTTATDTANTYARSSTTGNAPACTLRLRFN